MGVAQSYVQMGLLGEAVDNAPAAVLVADEHGDYVAVNATACELFGYDRQEFVRLNVRDIVVEEDVTGHYLEFIRKAGPEGGSVVGRRKDGSTFSFHYRAGRTAIGALTYYVSVGWAE